MVAGDGRLDEAIASYRRAIAIEPKNAVIHSNRASSLRAKHDWDGTIFAYRCAGPAILARAPISTIHVDVNYARMVQMLVPDASSPCNYSRSPDTVSESRRKVP